MVTAERQIDHGKDSGRSRRRRQTGPDGRRDRGEGGGGRGGKGAAGGKTCEEPRRRTAVGCIRGLKSSTIAGFGVAGASGGGGFKTCPVVCCYANRRRARKGLGHFTTCAAQRACVCVRARVCFSVYFSACGCLVCILVRTCSVVDYRSGRMQLAKRRRRHVPALGRVPAAHDGLQALQVAAI